MPNVTPKLKLKLPLGNEIVSRAAYVENLQILESNALTTKGNNVVNKNETIELKTDTRTTVLTYSNSKLAKVEEKDGSTVVKTTTLNYSPDGALSNVVETADGTTVTTTLNYTNSVLTSVSKAVN